MSKGHILIVEDILDVRTTICGLIEDAGYSVHTASSRKEALTLLETTYIHIAVLDIRLEESDEDNQDGLNLMHDIANKYPSIATIMLTGYADVKTITSALQPNEKGISAAFNFLEKSNMVDLSETIERAFNTKIKINKDLEIKDPQLSIQKLSSAIRFSKKPLQKNFSLVDEIQEVLKKLFIDCKKIELLPMQQGFSGAIIFLIEPFYKTKGRGEKVIIKIGNIEAIKSEGLNFQEHVSGVVGGNRTPNAIDVVYTRDLGGIRYTFLGLSHIEDFITFYNAASPKEIKTAIELLYLKTCFSWQHEKGIYKPNVNLKDFYMDFLHLHPEKLDALEEIANDKLFSDLGHYPSSNPISYIQKNDFCNDSFYSIIHGDLTGRNLLVDNHLDAWLIDFETTSQGHILQDYASLESYIKFRMVKTDDLELLFQWEKTLFQDNLLVPILPPRLSGNKDIKKADYAIHQIRRLAKETNYFTNQAYRISLLFNAIRMATFPDLSKIEQTHALLSAAIITEKNLLL